jgi:hypothetical protein
MIALLAIPASVYFGSLPVVQRLFSCAERWKASPLYNHPSEGTTLFIRKIEDKIRVIPIGIWL